jgi:hypothetical protein
MLLLLLASTAMLLICRASGYVCRGGSFDLEDGGSTLNHLERQREGGHRGRTAPCSISKIYTAYEDQDLGDGNRHGELWGGTSGLACSLSGKCTGQIQKQPIHLLGTDSHGCCCSAGLKGLGLGVSRYNWGIADVQRYKECDSTIQLKVWCPLFQIFIQNHQVYID